MDLTRDPATFAADDPELVKIEHPQWYQRFNKIVASSEYKGTEATFRKITQAAARNYAFHPAAVRLVLTSYLEKSVHTASDVNSFLTEITQLQIQQITSELRSIARPLQRWKKQPLLRKQLVKASTREQRRLQAMKSLDRYSQALKEELRICQRNLSRHNKNGPNLYALLDLALLLHGLTGHHCYPGMARLLQAASWAKGDMEMSWKADTLRKTITRFVDSDPDTVEFGIDYLGRIFFWTGKPVEELPNCEPTDSSNTALESQ